MTWQDARVAPAGTHHVHDGAPLYAERFDEALGFRAPGLAAVRRGDEAWHVRVDGSAAYGRRFRRTFGFYEGLSAAVAADGWRHLRPDGTDRYGARFDWCGNFQDGRCTVREFDGGYLHITPAGKPAYETRWRYAGDFRNGIAVVQADDGRSTHVDPHGRLLHGVWFLDLDVFHKGHARARDDDGWLHVDATGRPLYARRFAAVEPFYNGQARVEHFDGGLEVIDATGRAVTVLRPPLKSAFATLSDDLTGFWRTQAICAAVELGVFEALPASAGEVARTCGLDPARTRRLLRAPLRSCVWRPRWTAYGAPAGAAPISRRRTPGPWRTPPWNMAVSSRACGRRCRRHCTAPTGSPRTSLARWRLIPLAPRLTTAC